MTIQEFLMRRPMPVLAADGTGGAPGGDAGAAAAVVDAVVGNGAAAPAGGAEADAGGETDPFDIGIDLGDIDPTGEAEGADEWEDVDLDDLKVKVPKGMSQKAHEALMRQADYTKKTQAVAEREKALAARESVSKATTELDGKINEGIFHLRSMDNDLAAEYKFFNSAEWLALQQNDPAEAQNRFNRFQLNKDTRAQLAGALQTLGNERNSKLAEIQRAQADEISKRREQLPREIAKLVPGWNSERHASVREFAQSLGYAPEALEQALDPIHWQTLDLARIGKAFLQAKARKGGGAVEVKPAAATKVVGARGGGAQSGPSDKDNINDWMARERARVAKKSAR